MMRGWKKSIGVIGLTASVVAGTAAGAGAFLLLLRLTARVALLQAVAIAAYLIVAGGLAWLASALLTANRRLPLAVAATALGLAVALSAARVTILKPMSFPYTSASPPEGVRYWDLTTGSRLAYIFTAATGDARRAPVIFLHGGPGQVRLVDDELRAALAEDGFDVYAYHQYGAGLSSRAAARRPDATLVLIPGAGHEIRLERPRLYLETLRAFLRGEELPLEPYRGW